MRNVHILIRALIIGFIAWFFTLTRDMTIGEAYWFIGGVILGVLVDGVTRRRYVD